MNNELNERRRSDNADGSAPPARSSLPTAGPDGHFDAEVLAGYVADTAALPLAWRAVVEEHLAECPACRLTVSELQSVVTSLAALPDLEPPRSFALTPELIGRPAYVQPVPTAVREPSAPIDMRQTSAWHARQMQVVRWATVAAAVLFVFVLSADITSNRFFADPAERETVVMSTGSHDAADTTAPAAFDMSQPESAAQDAAPEEAAGTTEEFRTTVDEESSGATTAAADGGEQAEDTFADVADSEKQEAIQFQDGSADGSMLMADDDDRRSMSTARHFWRLAQVGLALLIVWLLAAMIALPRLRSGNRRQ